MPFFKKEQKAINKKWYPRTVTIGRPVEMDEVCDRIAEMSTASAADTKAVLTALGSVLGSLMNTGRTVHLDGLGYFYYGCVAEGTGKDTPEEVTAECITATRVRFLPERNVQQNGTVTRNLVGKETFWVDVETLGTNPDKVDSPDDDSDDNDPTGTGEEDTGHELG